MILNYEFAIYPKFINSFDVCHGLKNFMGRSIDQIESIFDVKMYDNGVVKRIYFGNDCCIKQFYRNMPEIDVMRQLKEEGYLLSIVTPPLFQTELKNLFEYIVRIEKEIGDIEVIINDIGFAFFLRNKKFEKKIFGVLSNKSLRDPRITKLFNNIRDDKKELFSITPFTSKYMMKILLELKIQGLEFDSLIQGIETSNFNGTPFFGILHFPYLHITRGYSCFWAGSYKKNSKFISDNKEFCNNDCEKFGFKIEDVGDGYVLVGNQILYPLSIEAIRKILVNDKAKFFKRIVFNYI